MFTTEVDSIIDSEIGMISFANEQSYRYLCGKYIGLTYGGVIGVITADSFCLL
jgi:hypothetical protein